MTRRPNFFIVGAAKAGTTSMHEYLAQHPDIFMSTRKEPKYFAPDLDSGSAADALFFTRELETYLSYFAGATDEKIVGESSPTYLSSGKSARLIREFEPRARILIMLREPLDLIEARHRQAVWRGREDILDIAQALAAEPDRRAGRRLPPDTPFVEGLFYVHNAALAPQVQRYIDTFARDQVHVVVLEDLRDDPRAVLRGVLGFLGVDAEFVPPDMTVFNAAKVPRYPALRRVPSRVRALRHDLKQSLPEPVQKLIAKPLRVRQLNKQAAPKRSLPPALEAELITRLAPDVEALSELIGRDLKQRWPRFAGAGRRASAEDLALAGGRSE